jgi:hypothetical protein
MIDYRTVMNRETIGRIANRNAELARLFDLPDRWLARELLSHARAARDIGREIFGFEVKRHDRYQSELVWDIIPEIAARLGETSFFPGERGGEAKRASDAELRHMACEQLYSRPLLLAFSARPHRGLNVYALLTNWPSAGNPVVFALDRFAPADRADPDWAARAVNQVARSIGYGDDVMEWHPDFMNAGAQVAFDAVMPPPPENVVRLGR